jgi:hypothetical protein
MTRLRIFATSLLAFAVLAPAVARAGQPSKYISDAQAKQYIGQKLPRLAIIGSWATPRLDPGQPSATGHLGWTADRVNGANRPPILTSKGLIQMLRKSPLVGPDRVTITHGPGSPPPAGPVASTAP